MALHLLFLLLGAQVVKKIEEEKKWSHVRVLGSIVDACIFISGMPKAKPSLWEGCKTTYTHKSSETSSCELSLKLLLVGT